jgi:hypothetical protein
LAPKKKQSLQTEKRMMEESEKMEKQGVGIEELLKQLLDQAASSRSTMARMEESVHELKMVVEGSLKRIEAMEKKVDTPPPPLPLSSAYPPPSGNASMGRSPLMTEKLLDPGVAIIFASKRETGGVGKEYLEFPHILRRVVHLTLLLPLLLFAQIRCFGKYLEPVVATPPNPTYPVHKHLPKLDFPKFNGENPKI